MKLTDAVIKDIADNLDSGLRCFVNLKTNEIEVLLDLEKWPDSDEEYWEDAEERLEKNRSDYHEFESLSTYDQFQIMYDFIDLVEDPKMQLKLVNALNRTKPFRNFKFEIEQSGENRKLWFDFKLKRGMDKIREQIIEFNRTHKIE